MEPSIHNRLSRVEGDFLKAATRGLPALALFHDTWSALVSETDLNLRTKRIHDETISLGILVASRIATLSDHLREFQTSADDMQVELERIFARIGISDTPDDHPPNRGSNSPTTLPSHPSNPSDPLSTSPHRTTSDRSTRPPYIESAYRWLLGNPHNPYPSTEIREAMSLQTKSCRRAIDAWFIDARARIGWNALRKACFSNKRADIIDAATRFFVQEDPKRPLDSNVELGFVAIEASAKDLYSERFSESTLAAKLDVAIMDMTPEMKVQAKENERCRKREEKEQQVERSARDTLATSSYPSPDRSPHRSPLPSLPPLLSEDRVQPDPDVSNKRRHPSPGPNEPGAVDQPTKRQRSAVSASSATATPTGLPSPAPSSDDLHESSPTALSNPLPTPYISSRKRRSSDADLETCHAAKRPCNLLVWPPSHAISDPLPQSSASPGSSSIDDWFHHNFGIPNPVSVEAPDESVPVEIDFFNYSTVDNGALQEALDSPTGSVELSIDHISPTPEPPTSTQIPSCALDICTNDFNYDELFCDPEEATPELLAGSKPLFYATPRETDNSSRPLNLLSQTSFSIPSSNNPAPNSFDVNSFASIMFPDPIVDTAAIADFSTPVSLDPASGQQWFFPSIIAPYALLGPLDELHHPGLNCFAQDNSFMFDPSMMGLYTSDLSGDSCLPPSTTTDKAAKQRKLLAMREEARRLEAEIAAS